jgi:putative restriction endonuclease
VTRSDSIGCVAVTECVFFERGAWVDVPSTFKPQNLSGSVIDLEHGEGQQLWAACLERAAVHALVPEWVPSAFERQRHGEPQVITPRLGQGSFRLAVMEAYGGGCAVTGEHSMPALEAAHIRPYSEGGGHELPNGLVLRRDIHRLFDLGYVSIRPAGQFIVSPRLRTEFSNGHSYYALEGQQVHLPRRPEAAPDGALLAWHSETVFQSV